MFRAAHAPMDRASRERRRGSSSTPRQVAPRGGGKRWGRGRPRGDFPKRRARSPPRRSAAPKPWRSSLCRRSRHAVATRGPYGFRLASRTGDFWEAPSVRVLGRWVAALLRSASASPGRVLAAISAPRWMQRISARRSGPAPRHGARARPPRPVPPAVSALTALDLSVGLYPRRRSVPEYNGGYSALGREPPRRPFPVGRVRRPARLTGTTSWQNTDRASG
jgi:hypothetical protein